MKTYVITLERSKERNEYIREHVLDRQLEHEIIPAVDGSLFSEEDILKKCNPETIGEKRWWLTNGAIGCALSHLNAYKALLETKDKAALIIEDDVILPVNVKLILAELEEIIDENEIIQLQYLSFVPAKLSTVGAAQISSGGLYYPMNLRETIAAAAYVIGRKAAEGILKCNTPIESTSDAWHVFHEQKAFKKFRVLYPIAFDTKNFKSSIDYISASSFQSKISNLVNTLKIPIIFQVVSAYRARRKNKMKNYSLTDEVSPVYELFCKSQLQ